MPAQLEGADEPGEAGEIGEAGRRARERELRRRCVVIVAGAAALLAGIGWPAVVGRVWTAFDLGNYYLVARHFLAHALATGDRFLWLPTQFNGFYLHGDGAGGLYHPLHWLLFGALPLPLAFNLNLVLAYAACFAGGFLWLRRWALPRDAALLGAFSFAFSSFGVGRFIHLNVVEILAHLPWTLLAIDVSLRDARPRRAAWANAGLSLLIASELLMGHPYYVFYSGLAQGTYALFALHAAHRVRRLPGLALAGLLGIAAGAVQWWPTLGAIAASVRAQPSHELLAQASLHPAFTLELVAPYLVVHDYDEGRRVLAVYNGAATTVLAFWVLLRLRRLAACRGAAITAFVFAAAALFLAYGEHNGLFRYYAALPPFDQMRASNRYTFLCQLAGSVLAAIGFGDLCAAARRREPTPWRQLAPLLTVPVAAVAVAGGAAAGVARDALGPVAARLSDAPMLALGAALMITATALVAATARGVRHASLALVAFAVIDLGGFDLGYVWNEPPSRVEAFARSRELPPGPIDGRVLYLDYYRQWNARAALAGLRLAGGYAGLEPRRTLDYRDPQAMRIAGIAWVYRGRRGWLRVTDPLPRVRLVSRTRASSDPARDLTRIDIETTALVSERIGLGGGPPGRAELLEEAPGRARVRTRAPTRQLLVFAESFHPGWRARVDGAPRPLVRVNGDFLGCVVGPGEHAVELDFDPPALRRAELASAAALLAIALQLVLGGGIRRAAPRRTDGGGRRA